MLRGWVLRTWNKNCGDTIKLRCKNLRSKDDMKWKTVKCLKKWSQ